MSSRWRIPWNPATFLVILSLLSPSINRAEDVSDVLTSLDQKRAELIAQGKYSEAIPFAERAVELTEQSQGSDHPDTAISLIKLALLYEAMGAYAKAEPLNQRALAINEKVLGPDHLATAISLNNLAELYRSMGAYPKSESLYLRALAIFEKTLGEDSPDTATILNNLALLYQAMGSYAKAEPLCQRALAIREKVLGSGNPYTATSLNNLAMLYQAMGSYTKAEPPFQRALEIFEKALGADHPDIATSLNNLASLYLVMGSYAKAEPLYQRALVIQEKALGPNHPDTAASINNLAMLYQGMGAYSKAEPLYLRTLTIFEKALGADHPRTATSLNNLAELYRIMGAYTRAEPLYERALAIREKVLGQNHTSTALSLNNLAELYRMMGAYSKAEPLYQRALVIDEKALGADHPETATGLNNLALVYQAMGSYAKAEPLYQRALAIDEKALGVDHPNTATNLNNLASLFEEIGADSKAEPLYQRALTIYEKVLGSNHPLIANSLTNLAKLFWTKGRWTEARENFQRAAQIAESSIQRNMALGNESQKQAYLGTLTGTTSITVTFSLAAQRPKEHSDDLGLELALQRKGRISEILADTYGATRRSLALQDLQLFDRWREANSQYATAFFRGPGTTSVENYRALIDGLKRNTEELETQLSARSTEFRSQTETVTLQRVQLAIPANTALIEWFRYTPYNPKAKGHEPRWGKPRYVAYILKQTGSPVAVDIGEATTIERTLSDFLAALHDPRSMLTSELGRELDGKLLQPLRPHLDDVSQLFLSPDGLLNLLPFGALVDEQQHYLAERWSLTYLTGGRDLLRFVQAPATAKQPVVIADPDFGGMDTVNLARTAESRRSNDMADRTIQFNPLPGTSVEAQALQDILKLTDDQILTGSSATETAIKQLQGPRILHIATHGFFLPDQQKGPEFSTVSPLGQGKLALPPGENPLLRSGLALAGANSLHSGQDDGVLTALEVTGLDLTGTQLAVLSACETGVGAVQNGEGVYGLRRALVLAGVRTQLSSLWKVDDLATKDLMVDYYQRLQKGIGKSQALHQAQQAMRKDPVRTHPYYWASFIAIGEDKPIQQ